MTLVEFNQQSKKEVRQLLLLCCTSISWVNGMLEVWPFSDEKHLHQTADSVWNRLVEKDYLQAFEGHPRIGDVNSLREKYAASKTLASGEQTLVDDASEKVITTLSEMNQDYFNRFGFIFIVCATGKSADEMLALLQERLVNDRHTELKNAAEEQRKIFQIRLTKLLN